MPKTIPAGEFFPIDQVQAARVQFETHGHVGIDGTYDPGLGEAAAAEAKEIADRPHYLALGAQTAKIASVSLIPLQAPSLNQILLSMGEQAKDIGQELWPVPKGFKPNIGIILMEPGARGPSHPDDSGLVYVVGVTNLIGFSSLVYEDGSSYGLEPGRTVFSDPQRPNYHYGQAEATGTRTGLVAELYPKPSMPEQL